MRRRRGVHDHRAGRHACGKNAGAPGKAGSFHRSRHRAWRSAELAVAGATSKALALREQIPGLLVVRVGAPALPTETRVVS
ncbi:MAG: hypothetical protein ABIR54_18230 [Burkholderiaceae bacterium]|jgi:hypothetical protein